MHTEQNTISAAEITICMFTIHKILIILCITLCKNVKGHDSASIFRLTIRYQFHLITRCFDI